MLFSDFSLSRRLERAEGYACAQHAEARRRVIPDSRAEWIECAGAYAVFDGIDSPVTQSFGLGIFEQLKPISLDLIERFFVERGAPVLHEVSPLAGVAAFDMLCGRNYRPIEINNVLYRTVEQPRGEHSGRINVRVSGPQEAQLWTQINAEGWACEQPELMDFLLELGGIITERKDTVVFLAELDGTPGATATLSLHEGVALFAGAATIPKLRRCGLQAALLDERMRYAFERQCDLAMMVAEPGSKSQRNAERKQFRIAYTRTKWRLTGHVPE